MDIDLPDGSGLDVLRQINQQRPESIAIMITGNVQVDNTISALRGGAYDFIGKPINLEELRVTIRNGIEARHLRREVEQVRRHQFAKSLAALSKLLATRCSPQVTGQKL